MILRRRTTTVFALLSLFVLFLTAHAQDESPASLVRWIPADFAAYVRLDATDPGGTLQQARIARLAANAFQALRVPIGQTPLSYNDLFNLGRLDLESASFTDLTLPWLDDEIIVGYAAFGQNFVAADAQSLLILPARDPFQATATLRPVLDAQDNLTRGDIGSVRAYFGDQTAIAIAPEAVLIGQEALIRAALAVRDGAPALTDAGEHDVVIDALPEAAITAYLAGEDVVANGLTVLLGGDRGQAAQTGVTPERTAEATVETTPEANAAQELGTADLLRAWGETLVALDSTPGLLPAVLGGGVDAVGIALRTDTLLLDSTRADMVFHLAEPLADDGQPFDPALLDAIPRQAMAVWAGSDAREGAAAALSFVPFSNFAGRIFGGFPVAESAGSASGRLPVPDAEAAVGAFDGVRALLDASGIDLEADIFARLNGGFAAALLPRMNNPVPTLNTPYEVLIVAQPGDPAALAQMLADTGAVFLGDDAFARQETEGGTTFALLNEAGMPILTLAADGDWLLLGTGDAVAAAQTAIAGDNRLIAQPRWSDLSERDAATPPLLYADINALYTTFLPVALGGERQPFEYATLATRQINDDLRVATLYVTLNLPE